MRALNVLKNCLIELIYSWNFLIILFWFLLYSLIFVVYSIINTTIISLEQFINKDIIIVVLLISFFGILTIDAFNYEDD
jgi:hypothetical protein